MKLNISQIFILFLEDVIPISVFLGGDSSSDEVYCGLQRLCGHLLTS